MNLCRWKVWIIHVLLTPGGTWGNHSVLHTAWKNRSCTLIMHNVDLEKSISLDGAGSCERPEEFPSCIILLWSQFYTGSLLSIVYHHHVRMSFLDLIIAGSVLMSDFCTFPFVKKKHISHELIYLISQYFQRPEHHEKHSPVHLQCIYGRAVWRCEDAAMPPI